MMEATLQEAFATARGEATKIITLPDIVEVEARKADGSGLSF